MSTFFDDVEKIWSGAKVEFEIDKNKSFGEIILEKLAESADQVLQINGETGEAITKADVRLRTIRCVQNLRKLGCTSDHRIAIIARNHHNLTPLLFAAFCNGSPLSPLDVVTVKDGASHILQRVEPSYIFCDADELLSVEKIIDDIGLKAELFTVNGSVEGYDSIDDLMSATGNEDSFVCTKIADAFSHAAIYTCSSGSTGLPKSICMSHAFLIYMFAIRVDEFAVVMLCFSSLYWLSGIWTTITSAFKNTRIFTTQPFSTDLFFDLVEKYKVQFFVGPPYQVQAIIKSERCKSADLSSLLVCMSIGGYVPSILIDTMKEVIPHCIFRTSYGLSETGGGVSMTRPKELEECPNTVGRLVPGVRVKIVNIDTNEKCGIGEEGEICVKIPVPIIGYLRDETANKTSFDEEGYFITGDIGCFDETGRLFVSGRRKEIFKNRGFSLWPTEIEDIIQKHQAVRHACVVNVYDDEIMSDLVTAVVVKNEHHPITADEIYSLIADQLASYKRLEGGVYFVDELPMTPSGKVVRSKVTEMAQRFRRIQKQK